MVVTLSQLWWAKCKILQDRVHSQAIDDGELVSHLSPTTPGRYFFLSTIAVGMVPLRNLFVLRLRRKANETSTEKKQQALKKANFSLFYLTHVDTCGVVGSLLMSRSSHGV